MATTRQSKAVLGVAVVLLIVVSLVWPVGSAGRGAAAAAPPNQEPPRWAAPADGQDLVLRGAPLPAGGHPRLESSLNQLLAERHRAGLSAARSFAAEHGLILTGERVEVVLVSRP